MPGGCNSRQHCADYCSDFEHMEECIAFARSAGISMRDEESGEVVTPEQMRQMVAVMRQGATPGGCRSKDECEAYCAGGAHLDECLAFAEEMGFMSSEEVSQARELGGVGPGGCNSQAQCEVFCSDPANQEMCLQFAKDHNLEFEQQYEAQYDEQYNEQYQQQYEQQQSEQLHDTQQYEGQLQQQYQQQYDEQYRQQYEQQYQQQYEQQQQGTQEYQNPAAAFSIFTFFLLPLLR